MVAAVDEVALNSEDGVSACSSGMWKGRRRALWSMTALPMGFVQCNILCGSCCTVGPFSASDGAAR
jgi:hypothetical protein